jgi:16S rRNA (cytosine1402-N4)-methyltransferase
MPGRSVTGDKRDAAIESAGHIPVLLSEIIEALAPKAGETYVDGTFGAGGYTRAVLAAADCRLVAIDRDPAAADRAKALNKQYGERFRFLPGRFGAMAELLASIDISAVDGIMLDIGISSPQIDEAERGFSFMQDGPLDMRMSQRGVSAADVVNTYKEADLARIIAALGEERRARIIARAICAEREKKEFATTLQLADLVAAVIGRPPGAKVHPATRTFQALRIFVNDELMELARALAAAESLLKPGGRLVVVSFHSLEDRIVKDFLASRSAPPPRASRHLPDVGGAAAFRPSFSLINKKPIGPSEEEETRNPRARSAHLRAAIRLDAPARPFDPADFSLPHVPSVEG